jgi:ABC-type transport system substrate-binding protein
MDRPGVHFGLVALLLLAACTATSAQAPSTKTLVVAIPADPQHFNPAHYDWLAYACRGRLALQRVGRARPLGWTSSGSRAVLDDRG